MPNYCQINFTGKVTKFCALMKKSYKPPKSVRGHSLPPGLNRVNVGKEIELLKRFMNRRIPIRASFQSITASKTQNFDVPSLFVDLTRRIHPLVWKTGPSLESTVHL